MQNLRVFMPISPHPQYKEVLDFPPKGVTYLYTKPKLAYHSKLVETRLRFHGKLTNIIKIPRMMYVKEPCDLIHSSRGFLILNNKPWIIDLEAAHVFTSYSTIALRSFMTQKILRKFLLSKNCKKILPQSDAAKRNILQYIDCKGFEDKIETLYLTMRPCEYKKKRRADKTFTVSTIGFDFYGKGIQDLWRACEKVSRSHDIKLRVKCGNVPEKFLANKPDWVEIVNQKFDREELFQKMYFEADAFALPSFQDHFGLVLLEAMSAGVPCLVTDQFTFPEVVEHGKTGFVAKTGFQAIDYIMRNDVEGFRNAVYVEHPKIIKQLAEQIKTLADDRKLAARMGKAGRNEIENPNGKFSVERKRRKLREIYDEALRA